MPGHAQGVGFHIESVFGVAEAKRHIIGGAHRAGGADLRLDDGVEPAHARSGARAAKMKASPIRIIGSDRTWPIVRPPAPISIA